MYTYRLQISTLHILTLNIQYNTTTNGDSELQENTINKLRPKSQGPLRRRPSVARSHPTHRVSIFNFHTLVVPKSIV